jgi:FKBP-type peptidyl-prolyl cis-trans isomerase
MKLLCITIASFSFLFMSCRQHAVEQNKVEPNQVREKLVKLNQFYLKQEATAIKSYIKRRNWNMKCTESGLWYDIQTEGKGLKPKTGQELRLRFRLELLDGSLCYDSDSIGERKVIVGKDQMEAGLAEGLEMLTVGGKARFVLPAHLAHGVSGDGKCIPPRSAIVYHVEILSN